jgi:hypothetical protein
MRHDCWALICMPTLDIDIPHQLTRDEALQRVKQLLEKTSQKAAGSIEDLTEHWEGNTGHFRFNAKGFPISGTITVTSSLVEVRGQVPFAVSLFKSAIVNAVNEQAGAILAK